MSVQDEAELLARELFETRSKLRAAGRTLHDQIGPLLSAAGIRLDLLRTDHPQTALALAEIMIALEEAMERVRNLSRQLNPPPGAHLGLKKAVINLVERQSAGFAGSMRVSYKATASLPEEVTATLYDTIAAVLARTLRQPAVTRIAISARGARNVIVTIASNSPVRWPSGELAALNRRARPAGIILDARTEKSTIVFIRYAPGRPPRG